MKNSGDKSSDRDITSFLPISYTLRQDKIDRQWGKLERRQPLAVPGFWCRNCGERTLVGTQDEQHRDGERDCPGEQNSLAFGRMRANATNRGFFLRRVERRHCGIAASRGIAAMIIRFVEEVDAPRIIFPRRTNSSHQHFHCFYFMIIFPDGVAFSFPKKKKKKENDRPTDRQSLLWGRHHALSSPICFHHYRRPPFFFTDEHCNSSCVPPVIFQHGEIAEETLEGIAQEEGSRNTITQGYDYEREAYILACPVCPLAESGMKIGDLTEKSPSVGGRADKPPMMNARDKSYLCRASIERRVERRVRNGRRIPREVNSHSVQSRSSTGEKTERCRRKVGILENDGNDVR